MVSRPQLGSPKTPNLYPIDRRRLSRRRAVSSEFERLIMLEKINKQKLVVIGNGMAGIRTVETLLEGKPKTPFLKFGDRIRIEMLDESGRSIFGAIDQEVVRYAK